MLSNVPRLRRTDSECFVNTGLNWIILLGSKKQVIFLSSKMILKIEFQSFSGVSDAGIHLTTTAILSKFWCDSIDIKPSDRICHTVKCLWPRAQPFQNSAAPPPTLRGAYCCKPYLNLWHKRNSVNLVVRGQGHCDHSRLPSRYKRPLQATDKQVRARHMYLCLSTLPIGWLIIIVIGVSVRICFIISDMLKSFMHMKYRK